MTFARTAAAVTVATAVLLGTGCGMFRGENVYAKPADARPLEVPPELDVTATAATAPASVSRSQLGGGAAPAPTQTLGFSIGGERDAVFARVGQALDATAGLTIQSRAELLSAYDVSYQGSNFLVRVVQQTETTSYISAVDPRGVAPEGPAAAQLIAQLQQALSQ